MSNQQQYSLNMAGEGGEENDVVTMDDLQFGASLDVLLASEGGAASFVEPAPAAVVHATNNPPPQAASMVSAGSSNSTAIQTSDTTTSGTSSSLSTPIMAASGKVGAAAAMPEGMITHTTTQQRATAIAPTKPAVPVPPPSGAPNCIRPSPLTARLNFPMSAVGQPSHPFQGFAGQQGGRLAFAAGRKSFAQPRTTTPPMTTTTTRRKRGRDNGSSAVSEDESERQKRRLDRNLREQQRSHRITEQIGHLRDVLAASNVHFKPDKYSTLVSVVDYIKQLQSRSTLLDSEHQKLLDTIKRTNEMINNPHFSQGTDADGMGNGPNDLLRDPHGLEDEFGVFVRGLDYQNVFKHCGIALAVTSIDGKFMDCNTEFEELTGYSRAELLPTEGTSSQSHVKAEEPIVCPDMAVSSSGVEQAGEAATTSLCSRNRNLSLFNLLAREHMEQVFLAMSRMLKQPIPPAPPSTVEEPQMDYWTGVVTESRKQGSQLRMNVSLVRSPRGNPKFFNCSVSPAPDTKPAPQAIQAS